MPADPETSREMGEIKGAVKALGESVNRLERKTDSMSRGAEESMRRIYERIDAHATEARTTAAAMAESVVRLSSALESHTAHDDERFQRQDDAIKDAAKDRGRWWRALLGVAGGGGLGATIARWIDGGSGT